MQPNLPKFFIAVFCFMGGLLGGMLIPIPKHKAETVQPRQALVKPVPTVKPATPIEQGIPIPAWDAENDTTKIIAP
jgi:hypothetical protein